jgi:hypothetical protein
MAVRRRDKPSSKRRGSPDRLSVQRTAIGRKSGLLVFRQCAATSLMGRSQQIFSPQFVYAEVLERRGNQRLTSQLSSARPSILEHHCLHPFSLPPPRTRVPSAKFPFGHFRVRAPNPKRPSPFLKNIYFRNAWRADWLLFALFLELARARRTFAPEASLQIFTILRRPGGVWNALICFDLFSIAFILELAAKDRKIPFWNFPERLRLQQIRCRQIQSPRLPAQLLLVAE